MFGSLSPCQWQRVTANTLVKTGQGNLTGITCAQSSSMVVSVYDGTSTSGKLILNQIPLTAGNPVPIPAKCNVGIYVQVVSGSGDATVFYD